MRSCGSLTITLALGTCNPHLQPSVPLLLDFCRRRVFTPNFISCVSPLLLSRRPAINARSGALCHVTRCSPSIPSVHIGGSAVGEDDFIVVNFYYFVYIEDPRGEVSRHLSFLQGQGLDIHGRIYLNEHGINAQYSGPSKDSLAYIYWLREEKRFSDLLVQISPSSSGHAFPKLKLRYKPSLVQIEGGLLDLPLLDPSKRATPLSPAEWRKKLQAFHRKMDLSNGDNKNFILLDVRNGYEWDIGHFHGAQRPEVDCFRSTSFGMSDSAVCGSDPLASIDKDKTDILMYCTGGIRCDVYSTILRNAGFGLENRNKPTLEIDLRTHSIHKASLCQRQRGFRNVFTLEGGVSHYLKKEGPVEWIGNLFVFDSRLSLPPSKFNTGFTEARGSQEVSEDSKFGRCYACGSQVDDLRHRNCANLDCNLLFLCCRKCVDELRGCCCSSCKSAPRLRPVIHGNDRYRKWHLYRDEKGK